MKAKAITEAIKERYPEENGWITMTETTPPGTTRRMDAVSISMFPSQGIQVHGFEVKVNRSDLMSEYEDLTKSGELMQYCTHWWLVCPKGLTNKEELPDGWGLITAVESDGGIKLRKAIKPRVKQVADTAIDHAFWRTMLLRLWKRRPEIEFLERVKERARSEGRQAEINAKGIEAREQNALEESAELIKDKTGVDLKCPWHKPEEFWKAYTLAANILDGRYTLDNFSSAARASRREAKNLNKTASLLDSFDEDLKSLGII